MGECLLIVYVWETGFLLNMHSVRVQAMVMVTWGHQNIHSISRGKPDLSWILVVVDSRRRRNVWRGELGMMEGGMALMKWVIVSSEQGSILLHTGFPVEPTATRSDSSCLWRAGAGPVHSRQLYQMMLTMRVGYPAVHGTMVNYAKSILLVSPSAFGEELGM